MQKSYKAMRLSLSRFTQRVSLTALSCVLCSLAASASHAENAGYKIQPGDLLTISVWKEPDLQGEILVRPDGGLTFPLAGEVLASGHTLEELQLAIEDKLKKFIPDPVVNVGVKVLAGNRIYVLGKVNHPGDFPLLRPVDVMQALSLAGGATPFAAVNDIHILRREQGRQIAIAFRYGDVEKGRALEQNVLLKSGDTVVVP